MSIQIPECGLTDTLIRLAYPAVFRSKAAAERFAADNHLWQAGVQPARTDDCWRLVIDTHRAPMLAPWLRQQYPGITWAADLALAPV
jgi:hypothetical protein